MKKILALLLACSLLLNGCTLRNSGLSDSSVSLVSSQDNKLDYNDIDDPDLLRYMEDTVYSDLVYNLDSESYFVENVSTVYLSKEYLEELSYNSKENVFFGFSLSELQNQFEGAKFVFTLGDDGKTTVKELEEYDDTYDQVLRNVAIGTGVILLCVTVSAVGGVAGAPAVCMIFAASAKTGTIAALSSGMFGGIVSGVVNGIETKNFDQAVKSAALAASEGFKWGAITGTLMGGASATHALKGATLNGLTMNQAAAIQKESKYPLDVIKQFKTVEQYEICKKSGLKPVLINGKTALVRDINLDYLDEHGESNLVRMKSGHPALDPKTGIEYELHHIGQKMDSTLSTLTKSEHMQGGNNSIWHDSDIFVISKHAAEISSIIFRLRDLCQEKLDYLNKYEFYGRLAKNANNYIENHGDDLGVISSIIEEAIRIMKDWSRMNYFAYGSNMSQEQMSIRCHEAKFIRTIILPDYRFALDCEGVATIIESVGSFVQGVLWLISEEDMGSLDRYEGVSSNCYKKEFLKVPDMYEDDVDSGCMLVYISLRNLTPGNKRSGYMGKIIKSAKDLNFDDNYIAELEALVST